MILLISARLSLRDISEVSHPIAMQLLYNCTVGGRNFRFFEVLVEVWVVCKLNLI